MTHSACARLRRAHRVRRFDEKGPARTLNRLGIGSIWIARKPTFDRLAQSLSNEPRCASFQGAGFCLSDLAGRWGTVIERGYAAQDWLTFRQALAAGGCIRKGERGRTIFYADRFTPKNDRGHEQVSPQQDEAVRTVPFLKRFTVFNVAQCDGLPNRFTAEPAPTTDQEPHRAAEELIVACGADFRVGGSDAYYSPIGDYVQVPPQAAFAQPQDYYDVALHELGHWTGHKSRLGRDQMGGHGTPSYAREELCAELSATFLCATLGIAPSVRHADYLGYWLAVLRTDSRAIFKAASEDGAGALAFLVGPENAGRAVFPARRTASREKLKILIM